MPRITPQPPRILIKLFKKLGFSVSRTHGRHVIMTKQKIDRPLVIPKHKEVNIYTIMTLIRTAQISREEYLELLKDP